MFKSDNKWIKKEKLKIEHQEQNTYKIESDGEWFSCMTLRSETALKRTEFSLVRFVRAKKKIKSNQNNDNQCYKEDEKYKRVH